MEYTNNRAGTLQTETPCEAAIELTAATERDIPEILGLIRGLADYEHIHPTVTTEHLRDMLFGPQPAAEVLLAFVRNECAGFAIFFPTFAAMLGRRGLFLENIFVKPEWRGTGIGEALLGRLAIIAEERNCARIDWRCLDCNEPAIGFYKSQGADALTEWTPFRMDAAAIHELSRKTQAKEMVSSLL